MPLSIRPENADDALDISRIHRLAFGGEDEARLVDLLREGGFLRLSLVAELDGQIIGHILFSDLPIVTATGKLDALSLAPLAVLPERQSQGIGSELVRQGLKRCRDQGHSIVLVVGHRRYYPRFGFSVELGRQLDSPYAGDSFMALELIPGSLRGVTGRVEYPPPFAES